VVMRATRVAAGIGRALVGVGLLILLFVAYQLWGTDISASRAQDRLRQQWQHQLREAGQGQRAGSDQPQAATAPAEGMPIGVIQIPRIGLDKVVVQGTGETDLQEGPGHYSGTPLPGQLGNAAIAGHRTTYGAPFYNLNEMSPGDPILLTTRQGSFRYVTTRSFVVDPSDTSVIGPTSFAQLTLTTCNPRYSAAQRLIVQARLEGAPAPGATVAAPVGSSLAGEQGSWLPALWWGLGTAAAGAAVWLVARGRRGRGRRAAVYGAGAIGVLVLLFFFFESLQPVLPASL
jgi:sortase A